MELPKYMTDNRKEIIVHIKSLEAKSIAVFLNYNVYKNLPHYRRLHNLASKAKKKRIRNKNINRLFHLMIKDKAYHEALKNKILLGISGGTYDY